MAAFDDSPSGVDGGAEKISDLLAALVVLPEGLLVKLLAGHRRTFRRRALTGEDTPSGS